MPTDQLVSARDVLRAIQEVKRLGNEKVLLDWEKREPDMLEHLLEELSGIHHRVGLIAPHPKAERRLILHIENLVLVQITALRSALLRHWKDEAGLGTDTSLEPSDLLPANETKPEKPHGM